MPFIASEDKPMSMYTGLLAGMVIAFYLARFNMVCRTRVIIGFLGGKLKLYMGWGSVGEGMGYRIDTRG